MKMAKLINETTSNTKIGFSGPMWLACNSCAFTTISTRTLNIFGQAIFFFILKSLNNPLLCDKNLYLDIGTWDHRGRRGLAKSHTASASPAVQKSVFFLSQKYYFLRNSATHSPYNLFSILHKKIAPPASYLKISKD